MLKRILVLWLMACFSTGLSAQSQDESVVYEKLYDEPFDVYKLWIQFQPLYFDLFMANTTAGFGFTAQYLEYEKFDLFMSIRKPFGQGTDVYRRSAELNNTFEEGDIRSASYFEIGGTYHLFDESKEGNSKIVMRSIAKSSKARNRQKIEPVEFIKVPSQVREIVGIRGGFTTYSTSFNVADVAIRQNIEEFVGSNGIDVLRPLTIVDDRSLYSTINATGFFLGASYGQFRNVIIKPERFSNLTNNTLWNAYFDFLIYPSFSIADGVRLDANNEKVSYAFDAIKTNPFGFRLGLDGKFNERFTYSYGFEAGIRPTVQKRGTYVLLKLYFPVLATSLKHEIDAFESVGGK